MGPLSSVSVPESESESQLESESELAKYFKSSSSDNFIPLGKPDRTTNPCLLWPHYMSYVIKITYTIITAPTPTVAWTRRSLYRGGGVQSVPSVLYKASVQDPCMRTLKLLAPTGKCGTTRNMQLLELGNCRMHHFNHKPSPESLPSFLPSETDGPTKQRRKKQQSYATHSTNRREPQQQNPTASSVH